jgi:hypothetical protein
MLLAQSERNIYASKLIIKVSGGKMATVRTPDQEGGYMSILADVECNRKDCGFLGSGNKGRG